ncbi:MAG TPA: NYN domain-containing protein [Thermomicrobiales bacterium]|nr:NYN domain-containing protein [Thermomicrobiales bacterium]
MRNGDDPTARLGDVALLIDYENLQISLKRLFNVTTPQMSLIIQEAQEHGRLVLARAYAPWTSPDLAIDAENLYRQGIELIYVPSRKNSADVRLAVDAVETAGRSTNLTTFVIVTGDGDLIHPLNFLRQQGRKVVVIGVDAAMSRMLSAAADAVLLYERDLDPSVRERHPRRTSPRSTAPESTIQPEDPITPAKPRLAPLKNYAPADDAFRMVQEALTRRGNGEPVLFQELGHWLSQDYSLRPRAWYGVPFSVFMEAAEREGYVAVTTSGGNSFASLPTSAALDIGDDTASDEDSQDDESEEDIGSNVRLESLRTEEQRDLFDALRQLQASKRAGYLSFRTILNHLLSASVLPRLSEWQIRRLLNDLANRKPPILVRSQKKGKTSAGQPYSFSSFVLTKDDSLLDVQETTAADDD